MPKNIVICCDGTNNEISGNQTNVLRLFRMLVRDDSQAAFYDPGVGTHADPTAHRSLRRRLYQKLDAAVGLGVRDNVLDAYRFLMKVYEPGDRVYLFGFSRGAYTTRALAAMLHYCGLLHAHHEHLCRHAWAIFTDENRSGSLATRFRGAARIKKVFSREVEVAFMGGWDTVSSFGWIWDPLMIPNSARCKGVHVIRHAVSVDETRAYFRPNHVFPGPEQDARTVWFPGVHADIGGGYPEKQGALSRLALEWMLGEATGHGLRLEPDEVRRQLKRIDNADGRPELGMMHDESRKLGWRILGMLPRRVFVHKKKRLAWRWPNLASSRVIPEGAFIHESVKLRVSDQNMRYAPRLPVNYELVSTQYWNRTAHESESNPQIAHES